eukprot:CAMPEP_0114537628 /NCGR_PEP_ID=MMETSP0109-20121206/29684_1 /TAXON_ID=29199 /ORGANISM="Chlorarachnion reptans, Strain CCCM449" /LENGTH=437 /DNA_ID=CAMNT_0001721539 /DNA_START=55 /DNA_END=1368 /DNA_ORIENTATION=+
MAARGEDGSEAKLRKVVFLHPDLGLGGAEKLIVQAAVAKKGHEVIVYTSHFNAKRCFEETKNLHVEVAGDWIPRSIAGYLHIIFALLRSLWLSCYVVCTCKADVFITDQIAAYNLFLRMFTSTPIVFYCHYPDLLLSTRTSVIKKMYRLPFDILEEVGTWFADTVLVNSSFTADAFRKTFQCLSNVDIRVLYPAIALPNPEVLRRAIKTDALPTFVSINRFERKKNIALAIHAFAMLQKMLYGKDGAKKVETDSKIQLIVAGGWDARVAENVEYHEELVKLARSKYGLQKESVKFIRSFSDEDKLSLLANAAAVLYTPENEHFGIVPIEAMAHETPVIAQNNGGPKESIKDGVTGYLCESNPKAWAARMLTIVKDTKSSKIMGKNGRGRVQEKFSFATFQAQFHDVVTSARHSSRAPLMILPAAFFLMLAMALWQCM